MPATRAKPEGGRDFTVRLRHRLHTCVTPTRIRRSAMRLTIRLTIIAGQLALALLVAGFA
jgi:hypothetical protein